jgi:DNA ligase D-like protein (predicted 3'-phosphoesterase)
MAEHLEEYRAKRHAGKTPEPLKPKRKRKRGDPQFIVQRHSARRLHYDLRLERDGVLLSWALPRGVPLRAGERALAVHVEDHPLEYADFEGEIPAGQYGAGYVELWDRGTYEVVRERPDGTLTVILHGGKLKGEWALVPARLDGEERNWLIVRAAKDDAPGEQLRYEPMLPREAKRVPAGSDWAFEIAWDGVRALAPMEGTRAHFVHAGGGELDERTKQLLGRMPRAVRTSDCVLDGVICSFDEGVVYVVCDLLDLEGASLIDLPWSDRRTRLTGLLDDHVGEVRLSRDYDDGAVLRKAARAQGLGIVAKRRKSLYRPGLVSDDWRLLPP